MLAASLFLSGCKTGLFPPRVNLNDITLIAQAKANDDSPVAVEIVIVRDEALAAKLQETTASQWFETRNAFQTTYPKEIQTWYYELPPGKQLTVHPTEFSGKSAYALLLFANYRNNQPNRLRLDPYSKATVLLSEKEIKLMTGP